MSILSSISKIYERCLYDQIQVFLDSVLSKYQCRFRKGYNTQHYLIPLIDKSKKSVDNGGAFGVLFNELSKAFDCLFHELLNAKLDAYGFDKNTLKLVNSYLTYRKQRVKINDKYSSWSEVPQSSILGPLLFSVFTCDMFYFLEDFYIVNYADSSSPYNADKIIEFVVNNINNRHQSFFNGLTATA